MKGKIYSKKFRSILFIIITVLFLNTLVGCSEKSIEVAATGKPLTTVTTASPTISPTEEPTIAPTEIPIPTSTPVPTQEVTAAPPAPAAVVQPKVDNQTITVYVTNTGKKYHTSGCRYLSKSKIPISLEDAQTEGYGPCSVCHPPQ